MASLLQQTMFRTANPSASSSRSFVTSAIQFAAVKGKAAKPAMKKRQGTSFNKGGGATKSGGSSRIQHGGLTLRSTLAKEPADLSDLVQLYPESMISINVAKPSVFPRNTYDQLKTFGMPRKLEKELAIGAPSCVIRQATIDLVRKLQNANNTSSKDSRYVLNGDRGSGKSLLLLQAVSYALESGWIVLYVPQASKWIDSSSSFAYDAASKTFHQPALASALLKKLLAVNRDRLAEISLQSEVILDAMKSFPKGTKLDELVALGAKDERVSVPALEASFTALSQQTQFPVLVALDEMQALFRRSSYRAPDYSPLESYHLSTPLLTLDYLSGRKSFARGAIITSLSYSAPECSPTPPLLQSLEIESRSPIHAYTQLDEHHLAHARSGMKRFDVPFGMTGNEAAAMFELWTRKGWTSNASDEVFLGGFTSAAGNPLELGRNWTSSHQAVMI